MKKRISLVSLCAIFLVGCSGVANEAPVESITSANYSQTLSRKHPKAVVLISKPIGSAPEFKESSGWQWPVTNYANYSVSQKGIDFKGQEGQAIYASHSGKVVYSSNKLKGYGELIILRHGDIYLSAYAYNKSLLVHEGDWVKAGQKIAIMGKNSANQAVLHFEIRKQGQAVSPLIYLYKS